MTYFLFLCVICVFAVQMNKNVFPSMKRRDRTASQLALAWVLAQGDDIIPIPGTKRRTYLDQNIAALEVELSAAERVELDQAFPPDVAADMRYPESFIDSVNA